MRAPHRVSHPRTIPWSCGIWLTALGGCGVGLAPPPSRHDDVRVDVRSELGAALGQSSRFRVEATRPMSPGSLWVLRGELSSYALGQLRRDEASQSLLDRRVPSLNWTDAVDGARIVAPLQRLEGMISLAEVGQGVLFQATLPPEAATLRRVWPPSGQRADRQAFYCFEGAGALDVPNIEDTVTLEPSGELMQLQPGLPLGLEVARCVSLSRRSSELANAPSLGISPVSVGGFALEPTLFETTGSEPPAFTETICEADAEPLPWGCVTVLDDRVVVTVDRAVFLAISLGSETHTLALAASEPFAISGLEPQTTYTLSAALVNLSGFQREAEFTLTTRSAFPRVILNEVLANPKGPEPQQEWVELYNEGRAAADLRGFTLEDGAGSTSLPGGILLPGGYALVVSDAFDPTNASDIAPSSEAQLIRVPKLGTNGLSNSGELLQLRDASGTVVSSFPAAPLSTAGVSVGRAHAGSDGQDVFALHAAPGASPGWENSAEIAP